MAAISLPFIAAILVASGCFVTTGYGRPLLSPAGVESNELQDKDPSQLDEVNGQVKRGFLDATNRRVGSDEHPTINEAGMERVREQMAIDLADSLSTMMKILHRFSFTKFRLPTPRNNEYHGIRTVINKAEPQLRFIAHDNALKDRVNELLPDSDLEPKYKTCAVVGNSANLLGSELGGAIDAHSAVFRINGGSTAPQFTQDVGRKATYRVLNNEWSKRLLSNSSKLLTENYTTVLLFDSRSIPQYVGLGDQAAWQQIYFISPELGDLAWETNANITRLLSNSHVLTIPRERITPTTGWLTLFTAMTLCDKVNVYGFSSPVPDGLPNHYSDTEDLISAQTFQVQSFIVKMLEASQGERFRLCLPFFSSPACTKV